MEYNLDSRLRTLTEHIKIGTRMEDLAQAAEMFFKDRQTQAVTELLTTEKDPAEIQRELKTALEFKKFIDALIARGKVAEEKKATIEANMKK